MASKEPGKKQPKKAPAPGLMTRGRLQRLQSLESPTKTTSQPNEQEGFENKANPLMPKEEGESYRQMMGNWYPQGMWPQNQMMMMPEGQKMMPKQPGFYIPPIHPQLAQQMGQQMPPMNPNMPQMPQMGIHPGPIPPMMPIHPSHMQPNHGMPPMNPKMPPMGPMMMPGMRGVPFTPKSPQPQSPMTSKNMRNMPNMQNLARINNIMRRNVYKGTNPDSPTYIKQQVIRNRYSKLANSPKSMEAFLNETLYKEEKVDLNELLREEITKILEEELDRVNDLYTDKNNYLTDSNESKDDSKKEVETYTYNNLPEIVEMLIESFKPILEVLWRETKKYHQYSLDEYYYVLNPNADSSNQLGNQPVNLNKPKKKNKKRSDNYELVVVRDFEGLRTLFQKRDEIEKLMSSYRNISRSLGSNVFTFSNFNTGTSNEETDNTDGDGEVKEDPYLKKAIEYADVALNQKLLLNNVTALDFKAALSGDYLSNYLPNTFRNKLIETVSAVHFDLGTPPQLSPKLSAKAPEHKDVLSKVCETLESFKNVDTQNLKSSQPKQTYLQYIHSYNPFFREERLMELMSKQGGVNSNFNLPPGVNLFPNLDPNPSQLAQQMGQQMPPMNPNMPQMPQMQNMPMNMPNMGKGAQFPPGNQQNFNIQPGSMPPQMPMVMPMPMQPHMANNNNQFYNK